MSNQKRYHYVGNLGLIPEEDYNKQIKEERKRKQRIAIQNRKKKRLVMFQSIGLATLLFSMAASSLYINGIAYEKQSKLQAIEEEIINERDIQESLELTLLETNTFAKLNDFAKSKNMRHIKESDVVYMNTTEYFSHIVRR